MARTWRADSGAAVTQATYGRAFGSERTLDTLGAIVGPATALWLLAVYDYNYPSLFTVTLLPGLLAAGLIAFLVVEKQRTPIPNVSFAERLQMLPTSYRRFLVAVGLFGAGDFAHMLLILLATQNSVPCSAQPKQQASPLLSMFCTMSSMPDSPFSPVSWPIISARTSCSPRATHWRRSWRLSLSRYPRAFGCSALCSSSVVSMSA